MKTLQQFYTEIMESDEKKKAFAEAAKDGKVTDFLKAEGCEASLEEIQVFLREKANEPLSDEELDNAAGGGCNYATAHEAIGSTLSLGMLCALSAIVSAADGYVGKKESADGRICNKTE